MTLKNDALKTFDAGNGAPKKFYSLPGLGAACGCDLGRLPISIRLVLESVLRNCDGEKISEEDVLALAKWRPVAPRTDEIPFVVARIVLQDFTGVPLLVDLAAMRSAVRRLGGRPEVIEPLVPVDLVVDHSIQVDRAGTATALQFNIDCEFERNGERYEFLKWGMGAFKTFRVVPPGVGIIHQVNLEYLASGIIERGGLCFPDTLVGTDSHTTMINGIGIVGWGVGGIEAEAGMLGQPVYFLTPDVVGVHLSGQLRQGATATDMALTVTELLRKKGVVGKFVEFFGPGARALPVVDRATIANMAPEYGATMGFFPIDGECVNYLKMTGRSDALCRQYEAYYRAQGLFGMPMRGEIDYSSVIDLDLEDVAPSVAGPRRPQDRISLPKLDERFKGLLSKPASEGGYGKTDALDARVTVEGLGEPATIGHGSVLIAAITSCTNTSNPSVMLAAGLLARNAVGRGLSVPRSVKTSLAPGSRVVSDYLQRTGLQPFLDQLGFQVVGYGCATCIGNSGPLDPRVERAINAGDVVAAAVLSGNRNFEARIHPNIRANFLMSPPLVVAFALAGRVDIDLNSEPLGHDGNGNPVFLRDIWPSSEEVRTALEQASQPDVYRSIYGHIEEQNPKWKDIPSPSGSVYDWSLESTYIQEPPFFSTFSAQTSSPGDVHGARLLGLFGDSVTTDHISPAGSIKADSPAGKYLTGRGVPKEAFNSYGSRRGNDRVMTRGTFANVRIKNLMLAGVEGGFTRHQPLGEVMAIYDAAMRYAGERVPLIIMAGREYGTGSSRDWAAKGTSLLGVRAVVAQSFERIHRANLVGMGVLPLQFKEGTGWNDLGIDGSETFDLTGLEGDLKPFQDIPLTIRRQGGSLSQIALTLRIDTPIEVQYFQHGGILPFVLRQLLAHG